MVVGRSSAGKDVSWAMLSPFSEWEFEARAVLGLQLGVVFCWALGFLVHVRPVHSPCERAGSGNAAVLSCMLQPASLQVQCLCPEG